MVCGQRPVGQLSAPRRCRSRRSTEMSIPWVVRQCERAMKSAAALDAEDGEFLRRSVQALAMLP